MKKTIYIVTNSNKKESLKKVISDEVYVIISEGKNQEDIFEAYDVMNKQLMNPTDIIARLTDRDNTLVLFKVDEFITESTDKENMRTAKIGITIATTMLVGVSLALFGLYTLIKFIINSIII